MAPPGRPLAGWRVGISVSATGDELARHGFTAAGVNRFTVRLARALLAEGAGLAFAHDWREGGIMEAIASIAFDYQLPTASRGAEPPILNLIPWPDTSATDPALLTRLAGIVQVVPAGLPDDLLPMEAPARAAGPAADEHRYLRARGLTHLRRQLAARCHARVALGGRLTGYDGRLPGILEEVFVTAQANRPVYLAGLLGGAAELLGKTLIEERPAGALAEALGRQDARPLDGLYARHAAPSGDGLDDRDLNPSAIAAWLAEHLGETDRTGRPASSGDAGASLHNGLSPAENALLLHTDLEEEVIHLLVLGLKRLAAEPPAVSYATR